MAESTQDLVKKPKKGSNKSKWIALTIIVLLVLTVTFTVLWAQELTKDPNEGYVDRSVKVCLTNECVSAAASLIKAMNPNVNPCDDFYEFACGSFNKSEPMPDERGRWGLFDVLRRNLLKNLKSDLTVDSDKSLRQDALSAIEKARKYFATCTDSEGIREHGVAALLNHLLQYDLTLQNWPFNSTESIPNPFHLMKVARQFGNNLALFNNFILSNATSPRQNVINFEAASFTLDRFSLTNESRENVRKAYVKYGSALLNLWTTANGVHLEAEYGNGTLFFEQILEFEVNLASQTLKPEERRDETLLLHPRTLSEFAEDYSLPDVRVKDWLGYFREAWPEAAQHISESTVVNVREPNYYAALNRTLNSNKDSQRFLANYFGWKIIEPLFNRLGDDFRAIISEFRSAQTGTKGDVPKWETCIDVINDQLPNAVGSLYVKNHFREEAKSELNTMIDYLFKAFKIIIKESYWMTESTRKKALEKADKFTRLIAYEDYLLNNETKLNVEYETFNATDTYLGNYVNAKKFQTQLEGRKYVAGSKPTDWITGAAIVNAFYEPTQNSISFPAGILQPPFLGYGYPQFWNFAAIGTVIGHEITHGFDDQGSIYDGQGVLGRPGWWDEESRREFDVRAQGIINQYSNYNYLGYFLKGANNQGENIADNGGLRESYKAYKLYVEEVLNGTAEARLPAFESYTTDQMFYLSYAQVWCGDYRKKEMELQLNRAHSPGRYRIIGPLHNSEEFSRAYRCSEQTYMNPKDKEAVW